MASAMFCQTMLRVARAISMAVAMREGWSVWMTTSAVSMAASLPYAPMAIPRVGQCQYGGVVDSVTCIGNLAGRLRLNLLKFTGLVFGQEFRQWTDRIPDAAQSDPLHPGCRR